MQRVTLHLQLSDVFLVTCHASGQLVIFLFLLFFLKVIGKKKRSNFSNNKKIRFRTDTFSSNTSETKKKNDTTARYLQTLAHFGRWDEFSTLLKEAQSSGFNKSSLRFSTGQTDKLFEQNMKEQAADQDDPNNNGFNSNKKVASRFRVLMEKFPKFKSVEMDQDIFQTLILLTTLEMPYFLARVVFTVKFNVSSTTMVFYTTKNVIMVIFLVYRLWVKFAASSSSSSSLTNEDEDNDNSRDLMNMKL